MNWVQAFARQAESDLQARDVLADADSLRTCHALHFLQMACEKLCKASLIDGGKDPSEIQRSHAHIAKTLPLIVRDFMSREAERLPKDNWIVHAIRPLARRIELLNPAVRDGGRSPENCEYPWIGTDGTIKTPADHRFDFNILFERAGFKLLKVLRQAAIELQK